MFTINNIIVENPTTNIVSCFGVTQTHTFSGETFVHWKNFYKVFTCTSKWWKASCTTTLHLHRQGAAHLLSCCEQWRV